MFDFVHTGFYFPFVPQELEFYWLQGLVTQGVDHWDSVRDVELFDLGYAGVGEQVKQRTDWTPMGHHQ